MIAACTNELEKFWATQRSLGERFLAVRWRYGDRASYMDYTYRHIGRETKIADIYRNMLSKLIDMSTMFDSIENKAREIQRCNPLKDFATLLCRSRIHVERDYHDYKREIVGKGEEEAPGRVFKALINLTLSHARLFRKTEVTANDISIAARVAIDSIPFLS